MAATKSSAPEAKVHGGLKFSAVLAGILGLPLLIGGVYLVSLGGSWYYALAGAGYTVAMVELWRGRMRGVWLAVALLLATALWALFEVGLKFWGLEVRLVAPMFVAGFALLMVPRISAQSGRPASSTGHRLAGAALMLGFAGFIVAMFFPHDVVYNAQARTAGTARPATMALNGEWWAYARTGEGTRYAPLDQVNVANVHQLEQVWAAHSGDVADGAQGKEDQNTPLYVRGTVFHCSPMNVVSALEGATGKLLWRYDPKSTFAFWKRCRTLGYYDPDGPPELGGGRAAAGVGAASASASASVAASASAPAPAAAEPCRARLFVATIDGRLIALDPGNGQVCTGFGKQGVVDLNAGMGEVPPGFYAATTGPIVAGRRIMIGGWIADNYSVGEPSGVVRAFDAVTGELAWAWDLGRPGQHALPEPGQSYTRGTPNVWAPMSFDLALGLAYLPLGNATPDFYGGMRRPFDDEYNASVVAVDLQTGAEKWRFRTVNHDIWDYDIPAMPVLVDFPDGKGGTAPSVIVTTKRGYFFVLDRRDGKPLVEVAERQAPPADGTATGEYYAKAQPYPVGMASIGTDPLSESRMWGMIPIDHMLCRIIFRQHFYEGDFTPQSTRKAISYPGNNGGPNWGGATVDEERNIMVVADMRLPVSGWLVPREKIPPQDQFKPDPHSAFSPQFGLPFGQELVNFFSPAGAPCLEPPMGTISAIDLGTRQLLWQRPAGTMKDVTVLGIQPRIAFYVGMPALGGAVTTRGGLTFYSATQDYYLRAFNTETGAELWKARLPSGSQATPMSYFDQASGRQFIVVTAGGARYNPNDRGDWIIAFALPEGATTGATGGGGQR